MNADRILALPRWGSRIFKFCLCLCACCFSCQPALFSINERPKEQELDLVLKQMETVGRTFKNFSAKFSQKPYVAILKEFGATDTGVFTYALAKDGSGMIRREITGKEITTVKGGKATIYQPKIKLARTYDLGKNKDKIEYFALGMGQSSAKLQDSFHVSYQGSETIDGAVCAILLLKPKSPEVAASYPFITLWVKKQSGVPIRYKLQEPSGDYVLVNYTEEKLNQKLSNSLFEQKLPGVEIQ